MKVAFELNGDRVEIDAEPSASLADVLRSQLGATSVHLGCEQGVCGACAVLIDEQAARSCLTLAVQADGRAITTAEGIARRHGDAWRQIEALFVDNGAFQCGFCTSGMIVALEELLASSEAVERSAIADQLSGQICRCTGYAPIVETFESLLASAGRLREDGDR
jgi:aerobic-type carbon monoxide dehydrogenase small subunit (CoxS/CutS family)